MARDSETARRLLSTVCRIFVCGNPACKTLSQSVDRYMRVHRAKMLTRVATEFYAQKSTIHIHISDAKKQCNEQYTETANMSASWLVSLSLEDESGDNDDSPETARDRTALTKATEAPDIDLKDSRASENEEHKFEEH
jgi:hypothetical protein